MYMIAEVSQYVAVASFAEAWIEIPSMALSEKQKFVASFAEAWIEIVPSAFFVWLFGSPPSRRRGLKSFVFCLRDHFFQCRLLGNRQGFMF